MIDAVLDSVAARVGSLGLTFQGNAVPCEVRKHPRQEDGDVRHTQFTVSPAQRSHQAERFDSVSDKNTYRVLLVFWTPSNGDNRANLPELSALEDAARGAFNAAPADLAGIAGLLDVRAFDGTFLDDGAFLLAGWDATVTEVIVEVVKARAAA